MKLVLILLIHFLLRTQNAKAKEIAPLRSYLNHLSENQINAVYAIHSKELVSIDVNRFLSINDLWERIKNSITNAWNAIKDIASKIKGKIDIWVQDVKKSAEEIKKAVQAKIENLKNKWNKFIEAIKKIGGEVKQCVQEDKDAIQELLKQIAIRVATCIADNAKKVSALDVSYESKLALEDDEFIKEAENKINKCVDNVDNADECLNKARVEIYDDMERKESSIMDTRSESRDVIEDALETIMKCASDGIIEASEAITEEVMKIVNCVTSEKEKPFVT